MTPLERELKRAKDLGADAVAYSIDGEMVRARLETNAGDLLARGKGFGEMEATRSACRSYIRSLQLGTQTSGARAAQTAGHPATPDCPGATMANDTPPLGREAN
jgi:hypothetical protein